MLLILFPRLPWCFVIIRGRCRGHRERGLRTQGLFNGRHDRVRAFVSLFPGELERRAKPARGTQRSARERGGRKEERPGVRIRYCDSHT